jgi:hypothetical protein
MTEGCSVLTEQPSVIKAHRILLGIGGFAYVICHKTNNIGKCRQYLAGLFHARKSNIERMNERLPNGD